MSLKEICVPGSKKKESCPYDVVQARDLVLHNSQFALSP